MEKQAQNLSEVVISKEERNYGIDFLRIISMFFVVLLHSLGHGGVLTNATPDSTQYKFAWLLEIFAFCAVDIFALISGYVTYSDKEKKVKFSNYFKLWFQVVFYGLIITVVFHALNLAEITKGDYFKSILPVTTNSLSYWYFTAYTGLFVFIPLLNKGIRHCSEGMLKKLFVIIILVISIFGNFTNQFNLEGGYSVIWLIILYVLGAIIKKCNIGKNVKWYKGIALILLLSGITFLYKLYGVEFSRLNIIITKDIFISYVSPTMLCSAILYLIIFSKINFNNVLKKVIKFAAPSAFAVYLINNNNLIREKYIRNLFSSTANGAVIELLVYTIGFSILFVIGSILIDKIRVCIFRLCNIKEISNKIEELLGKIITKIAKDI